MNKINKGRVLGVVLGVIAIIGILTSVLAHNGNIKNQEQSRIEYKKEFDKEFNTAIEKCYATFDSVDGVSTVDIIDSLSEIDYMVEEHADKNIVLYQFSDLLYSVGNKSLDKHDLSVLYQLIVDKY